jgi:two-component system, OmpR family, KDP operon response regulator KdpE
VLGRKARPKSTEPTRPWRILLAGDNSDSVELLRRLLLAAGQAVQVAETKGAVLQALAGHDVTAVVLDFTRGSTDSMGMLETVRGSADRVAAAVPVVVSGSRQLSEILAWDSGADEVLRRPFWPEQLAAAVERAVARPDNERLAYRRAQHDDVLSRP